MTTLNLHDHPRDYPGYPGNRRREKQAVADRGPSDWREMRLASALAALRPWGLSLSLHMALVLTAFGALWWLLLPTGGSAAASASKPASVSNVAAALPAMSPSIADNTLAYAPSPRSSNAAALPPLVWVDPAVQRQEAHRPESVNSELLGGANAKAEVGESKVMWVEGTQVKAPPTPAYDEKQAKSEADRMAIGMLPSPSVPGSVLGPFGASLVRQDGAAARRVVVVIDASGSLIDRLPAVTREVGRWVATGLTSRQMFTVIAYRGDSVLEPRPTGLKEATTSTRTDVTRWLLDLIPGGRTDPEAALERALSYRPDAVVLVCDDAWMSRSQGALKAERLLTLAHSAGRGAVVSTVVLTSQPIAGEAANSGLAELARQTGGTHHRIGTAELGWE